MPTLSQEAVLGCRLNLSGTRVLSTYPVWTCRIWSWLSFNLFAKSCLHNNLYVLIHEILCKFFQVFSITRTEFGGGHCSFHSCNYNENVCQKMNQPVQWIYYYLISTSWMLRHNISKDKNTFIFKDTFYKCTTALRLVASVN